MQKEMAWSALHHSGDFGQLSEGGMSGALNLGPIAAKSGTKPGTTTQHKAKRTNQIDFLSRLCKPVRSRSRPPISSFLLRRSPATTLVRSLSSWRYPFQHKHDRQRHTAQVPVDTMVIHAN